MRYPKGPFAHGLMFHHFCDGVHARGQGAITAAEFDDLLEFVGPARILGAKEWEERSRRGELDCDDVCITFDDALRCQIDVALPVLEARGLTAFWFVYSSVFEGVQERLEVYRHIRTVYFSGIDKFYDAFDAEIAHSAYAGLVTEALAGVDPDRHLAGYSVYSRRDRMFRFVRDRVLQEDRYFAVMDAMLEKLAIDRSQLAQLLWMQDADLRRLSDAGHAVGLHSYSHPTRIAGTSIARQQSEYARNRDHLRRVLGSAPTSMAHPCNSYGPETLSILRDMGIELGFRANMQQGVGAALERPRADHADILAMKG